MKELSQKIGLEVLENEPLKKYTTFKIGGPAKFFVRVGSKADLFKSLKAAKELNLPFFILGGGSNILVSDKGFDGLVIKFEECAVEINENIVKCFAGCNLSFVINQTIENKLSGLEFAANIPGTIGGAVRGNAGAYGKGAGDFVEQVEVIDVSGDEISLKILTKEECEFDYRDSIFKRTLTEGRGKYLNWIITEVVFRLNKDPNAKQKLEEIKKEWQERMAKQPLNFPCAGCTFKNIPIPSAGVTLRHCPELVEGSSKGDSLQEQQWNMLKEFAIHDKIPAGKLIEEAGLKGKRINGAMVSDKHANFIVNVGNATADDVIRLIELVKSKVRDKFGVQLEEEIQYIGFN